MVYLVVVGFLVVVVFFGMIIFFIFVFVGIFDDLGGELFVLIKFMVGLSNFLRSLMVVIFVIVIVVVVFLFKKYYGIYVGW